MEMEDESKLKIFSGTAHPVLAKEICDYIGIPLGKAMCGRFNNGEIQVMINESVRGKDVFVIQPTGAPVTGGSCAYRKTCVYGCRFHHHKGCAG